MGRGPHKAGDAQRLRILEALADKVDNWQEPGSVSDLAAQLGMSPTAARFHVDKLRAAGLVHPGSLWITRAGYIEIRRPKGLLFPQ